MTKIHPSKEDDPEYRIAYDMEHRKVGCVLIQAALGGTIPQGLFLRYFGTDTWTLDARTCSVYPLRQSQLGALAERTRKSTSKKSAGAS